MVGRQGHRCRGPAAHLHRGHRPGAGRAGRVVGVRTDRDGPSCRAKVVVACDGVNSFLAKEAGLLPRAEASHHTLGVKEVLDLPRRGHRRALRGGGPRGRRHRDARLHPRHPRRRVPLHQRRHGQRRGGAVPPPPGGVRGPTRGAGGRPQGPSLHRPASCGAPPCASTPPTSSPRVATTPCPTLAADGLVIAGDAAAMTLAAGLWLEGVNFAIGSGFAAGRAVDRAIASGDCSAVGPGLVPGRPRAAVRPGRPQAPAQGPGPGALRPGPAAVPGPALRPGRGDVHRDQPDPSRAASG